MSATRTTPHIWNFSLYTLNVIKLCKLIKPVNSSCTILYIYSKSFLNVCDTAAVITKKNMQEKTDLRPYTPEHWVLRPLVVRQLEAPHHPPPKQENNTPQAIHHGTSEITN